MRKRFAGATNDNKSATTGSTTTIPSQCNRQTSRTFHNAKQQREALIKQQANLKHKLQTQSTTKEKTNATTGSTDSELVDVLKANHLYDDLYKILTDIKFVLEDLKVMNENDVDELSKQIGLSLSQKLKFRRLIKALHHKGDRSVTSNETKQSEEDQYYAQIQAKKKSEKSHRSATLKPDEKMTVLLIGDTHAGKTSLFRNFIGKEFKAKQTSTIG
eukprot:233688_1